MSVFLVYDGTVGDPNALYAGMGKAARRFQHVYQQGNPKKVFETLIHEVRTVDNCNVTYEDENGAVWNVGTRVQGMNVVVYYLDNSGNEVTMNLVADQDNPNSKRVTMAVPGRNVAVGDQYLTDAVALLNNKPDQNNEREAFLLGMLLLRRCR